jgi:hypothetical protein
MRLSDILDEHEVEAMVAADSFDPLVERITRMVTAGRTMAVAVREYTYLHRPAKVYGGLELDTAARSGGVWVDRRLGDHGELHSVWCGIVLTSGSTRSYDDGMGVGFGEDVYEYSGNVTEAQAAQRYRDHEPEHRNHFERRRDMTHIAIIGGVPGRRYTRDDSIAINTWNRDGVATEKVIGFDNRDGSW